MEGQHSNEKTMMFPEKKYARRVLFPVVLIALAFISPFVFFLDSGSVLAGAVTQEAIVTLCFDKPPIITEIPSYRAFVGQQFQHQVVATHDDKEILTYAAFPSWAIIDTSTGILSFTPDQSLVGLHTVGVTVTAVCASAAVSFALEVAPAAAVARRRNGNKTSEETPTGQVVSEQREIAVKKDQELNSFPKRIPAGKSTPSPTPVSEPHIEKEEVEQSIKTSITKGRADTLPTTIDEGKTRQLGNLFRKFLFDGWIIFIAFIICIGMLIRNKRKRYSPSIYGKNSIVFDSIAQQAPEAKESQPNSQSKFEQKLE